MHQVIETSKSIWLETDDRYMWTMVGAFQVIVIVHDGSSVLINVVKCTRTRNKKEYFEGFCSIYDITTGVFL